MACGACGVRDVITNPCGSCDESQILDGMDEMNVLCIDGIGWDGCDG